VSTDRKKQNGLGTDADVAARRWEWTWAADATESERTSWSSPAVGLARAIAWAKMLGG